MLENALLPRQSGSKILGNVKKNLIGSCATSAFMKTESDHFRTTL